MAALLEQVEKLCGRSREYGLAYAHPGGHRTSNMLDRMMRGMNRYFDRGQHLHGSAAASRLHYRAWALLANFTPWHPAVARDNEGWRCPAERLNRHRYHDDWLQNLLISASLGGYRSTPPPNSVTISKDPAKPAKLSLCEGKVIGGLSREEIYDDVR